jgi:hypothetical protein
LADRGESPLCVPSRLRGRDAGRAEHECRNQGGGEIANHIVLLMLGGSDNPNMSRGRRYFQYRLVLDLIEWTD